jgi:hypothetical protein
MFPPSVCVCVCWSRRRVERNILHFSVFTPACGFKINADDVIAVQGQIYYKHTFQKVNNICKKIHKPNFFILDPENIGSKMKVKVS